MEKTFYFVNGISPDEPSKKLMRRHVMKGKNAGKTIRRRSRLDLQVAQYRPNTAGNPSHISENLNEEDQSADWRYESPNRLDTRFGDAFLTFSLPVEVTPNSREIINEYFTFTADRIYPVKLGLSFHDAKFSWLRALFADEATYHCTLALMQACNEIFHGDGESSPKALYHLSQTFAQVKKRLEGGNALSDSTIALVLSLVNQEQARQKHSAAAIHIKGLASIIKLRGGLGQLEGNVPLVLKVCKTDIASALQHGGPTIFFRNRMHQVRNSLWGQGLRLDRILDDSVRRDQVDPYLREIFSDAMSICSLFNNSSDGRRVDYVSFLEILVSLCYRLLGFRSLNDAREGCGIQAAYHIGLTIFMMTIFLQYARRRTINYWSIPVCLRNVLQAGLDEQEDEFALWLMIMGGIWICDDAKVDWLALRIRATAQRLGFNCWDKARDSIRKYPWLNALHDQQGHDLWERVHCSSLTP